MADALIFALLFAGLIIGFAFVMGHIFRLDERDWLNRDDDDEDEDW